MKSLILLAVAATVLPASAFTSRIFDLKFQRADLDNNGQLTPEEFLGTQSGNARWTDAMFRFQAADYDDDGVLTPLEFAASRGGRLGGRPSKQEAFELADLDQDGFLDPSEWALTEPRARSWTASLRIFDRRDRDDDGLVSEWEFGIRTIGTLPVYPWFGRL